MNTPDPRLAPPPGDPAAPTPTAAGDSAALGEGDDEAELAALELLDGGDELEAGILVDEEPDALDADLEVDDDAELEVVDDVVEPPVAPPVVAVLVTSDPGPWLED